MDTNSELTINKLKLIDLRYTFREAFRLITKGYIPFIVYSLLIFLVAALGVHPLVDFPIIKYVFPFIFAGEIIIAYAIDKSIDILDIINKISLKPILGLILLSYVTHVIFYKDTPIEPPVNISPDIPSISEKGIGEILLSDLLVANGSYQIIFGIAGMLVVPLIILTNQSVLVSFDNGIKGFFRNIIPLFLIFIFFLCCLSISANISYFLMLGIMCIQATLSYVLTKQIFGDNIFIVSKPLSEQA